MDGRNFSDVRQVLVKYDELYKHLTSRDFLIDNSIKDPNLQLLKTSIVNTAKEKGNWNDAYPVRWIFLEKSLTGLREQGITVR